MVSVDFFPDLFFGWAFYAALVFLTAMAAVIDFRTIRVPKWLTISMLGLGVFFNLVRGGWLGAADLEVWSLGTNGLWIGILDGFLFSVVGFFVGFGLFLTLYILGACGGGDVKLFAALGTWLGPKYAFFVLAGTLAILVPLSFVAALGSFLTLGYRATSRSYTLQKGRKVHGVLRPRSRLMTYSFPVALATAVVMLIVFSADLKVVDRKIPPRPGTEGPGSGSLTPGG